ncbi:MAG TPA: phenylacetate--CoA ligase family protein [Gammaproteobacteria bacterium]|nr:phenylacetate--CoA ligase family protein [Gammaproteobacteria bacterium]
MPSLYTSLISSVIFPLQEKLKGHNTVAVRRQMERSQWWGQEHLRALQLQRLQSLLHHVTQQVPYFQQRLAGAGINAKDIRSLDDMSLLPFLTKADIRQNLEAMKSTTARGLARFNTGGSSGEPLIFFIGNERVSHDVAAKWRATRWWGVDIGDPEIVVWGSPIELGSQDRIRVWRDKIFRSHLLPAFEMSDEKLDSFLDAINHMRPAMLFGYPSALAFIAQHAQRRGRPMDQLGIKVAFVTAERTYDWQKTLIMETFGCRVANGYGGRDAGFIAHECPEGGLHITAEDVILEVVDAEGNVLPVGQRGELVVTHLATRDFPFIRYRTGDVGMLSEKSCTCGRGLPLLASIEGRTTDFVVAFDGTVMHGLALIYTVRDLPGVEAFKIIQESRTRTRVLLVTDDDFESTAKQTIIDDFRARLGSEVDILVQEVTEIPAERSGKHRYVVGLGEANKNGPESSNGQ